MSKIDEVRSAMMQAMKDKNKARKDALSLLLSSLKNAAIAKREDLTEEEAGAIVLKEIKQNKETIETSPESSVDIISECEERIRVYEEFAPKMMSEEEIVTVIDSVLSELGIVKPEPKDKGLIMKNLMPKVKGKADGKLVNELLAKKMN